MKKILLGLFLALSLSESVKADSTPSTNLISWKSPNKGELAALVFVESTIVVDLLQTQHKLNNGWTETNPILGPFPSTERLWAFGALGMATTAALTFVLPEPFRGVFLAGVGGAELGIVVKAF